MSITPFGKKLVLRKASGETQSKGGLYLPSGTVENNLSIRGVVVSKGRDVDPAVKVGDELIIQKNALLPIEVAGDDLFMVHEDDIWGRVDA